MTIFLVSHIISDPRKDTESVGGKFHAKASSSSSQRIIKKEIQEDTKDVLDFLLRDDVSIAFTYINQ